MQGRSSQRSHRDQKDKMQKSVVWSPESWRAVAPEEGDKEPESLGETLGLQSNKSLWEKVEEKKKKKEEVGRLGLAERPNDLWQFSLAMVRALWKKTFVHVYRVCLCEDRKIVPDLNCNRNTSMTADTNGSAPAPRNHFRWSEGPRETQLVMCNGATGLSWKISQLWRSQNIV